MRILSIINILKSISRNWLLKKLNIYLNVLSHSYIWSHLKSKIIFEHLYIGEKWLRTLNELVRDNLPCFLLFYIDIVFFSCCIYYLCTELVICIAIRCMTCCCIIAEQKLWCLKRMYCCRRLCFLSIILFLIGYINYFLLSMIISFSVLPLNSNNKCVRCHCPSLNIAVDFK